MTRSRARSIASATLGGVALVAAATILWLGTATAKGAAASTAGDSPPEAPEIVGPLVHDNLAVYLLRGEDRVELDGVITLAQALEEGKAVVRETGNVSVGALKLYRRAGFKEIPAFPPYKPDPLSIFMERPLR